jgi:hypothetical protein
MYVATISHMIIYSLLVGPKVFIIIKANVSCITGRPYRRHHVVVRSLTVHALGLGSYSYPLCAAEIRAGTDDK